MSELFAIGAGMAWVVLAFSVGATIRSMRNGRSGHWKRILMLVLVSYGLGVFLLLLLVAGL